MESLARTPLYEAHRALGGRLVGFAGYDMPVQYSGVLDEHHAVRTAVGLFDVSHMGEVEFSGPGALEAVNRLITNDLLRARDGQAIYTAMCRADGRIIDDLVVYRFSPERVLICVNASNRAKDFAWMRDQTGDACTVQDVSEHYAQIAVQGPRAPELVQRLADRDVLGLRNYHFATGQVDGRPALISRTGYTGEDGFELYVAPEDAAPVWQALLSRGQDLGVKPCGLGARDSLRLEAKMCLYGNDIDETTSPLEAGLGWVVKLDKPDFIGRAALEAEKTAGLRRKLVGFEMIENGIARHGYPIVVGGEPVGLVTSGTKSPTLGKAIGLGYVPATLAEVGQEVGVQIRDKITAARIVRTPFYKRAG